MNDGVPPMNQGQVQPTDDDPGYQRANLHLLTAEYPGA